MMVRTAKSVYQIHRGNRAFRRVGGAGGAGAPPLGVWRAFKEMGPVAVGRPLHFLCSWTGNSRQLGSVKTLTTSPVVEIMGESAGSDGHGRSFAVGDAPSR